MRKFGGPKNKIKCKWKFGNISFPQKIPKKREF
jgi:hypothetical protein